MRSIDDGVGPKMGRASVEGGENPALGVWESPLRLVALIGDCVRRYDLYAA